MIAVHNGVEFAMVPHVHMGGTNPDRIYDIRRQVMKAYHLRSLLHQVSVQTDQDWWSYEKSSEGHFRKVAHCHSKWVSSRHSTRVAWVHSRVVRGSSGWSLGPRESIEPSKYAWFSGIIIILMTIAMYRFCTSPLLSAPPLGRYHVMVSSSILCLKGQIYVITYGEQNATANSQ